MDPRKILLEFVQRYGPNSPLGELAAETFVREVLKAEPDEVQIEVLRAFSRGARRISVVSCHGTGKTTVASWCSWIMLITRFPQKTAVTAPTKAQLEDAFFAEMLAWHARLPEALKALFEVKKNRIELAISPGESFLAAKTARDENPEALQGVHSENVLLIADEASGVSEKVFEAAAGSMSTANATTLLLSNPVRTSGFFYDTHHSLSDMWVRIHATAVPGTSGTLSTRVDPDFIEQIARTYGRGSNAWRVRVLGQFPKSDADTIIPFELVEGAQNRDIVVPKGSIEVWGLDVARFGDDENALVRRNKLAVLPLIETWQGKDLMYTTGRLKRAYDDCLPEMRPETILIDEIGMGGGVVDRARELALPVRGVNVSERDSVDDRYHNLRTELWFKGREWLAGLNRQLPKECSCGKCSGMEDHAERLAQELVGLKYDIADSSGKLLAEPKKAYKKRTKKPSPNIADAFLLTFAAEASTLMHGSKVGQAGWVSPNQPLRRKRSVV